MVDTDDLWSMVVIQVKNRIIAIVDTDHWYWRRYNGYGLPENTRAPYVTAWFVVLIDGTHLGVLLDLAILLHKTSTFVVPCLCKWSRSPSLKNRAGQRKDF